MIIEPPDEFGMAQQTCFIKDAPLVLVLLFSFLILPQNHPKSINIDIINNKVISAI